MAVDKYTGRSNGFTLEAYRQDPDHDRDVFVYHGVPVRLPAGRGVALFLQREKKYAAILLDRLTDGAETTRRLIYPIHKALHPAPVVPRQMTVEQFEAFSAASEEAAERINEWTGKVQPLIENALAALED